MPFNFKLPTTSNLDLSKHLSSSTHPSLPLTATIQRGVLRDALKTYRRLPAAQQPVQLNDVLGALQSYMPYLLALDAGRNGRDVADEHVGVAIQGELAVEWRPVLSSSSAPGRTPGRVKLHGLDGEMLFVLSTLACVHALLARNALLALFAAHAATPSPERRAAAIAAAMRHFLDAHAVWTHALSRPSGKPPSQTQTLPADISPSTFSGLASLALAEATLISVLKDDPYPASVAQDRNKNDKEWMFKPVELPKVRAALFARLCLAAGEHAAKAVGSLNAASAGAGGGGGRLSEPLVRYADDLRRVARAKACRFLALDADLGGRVGEAVAWLGGARRELGLASSSSAAEGGVGEVGEGEDKKKKGSSGLSRLKHSFAERREDRKLEKGVDWGADAGRFEEARVLDMLLAKLTRINDTVNVQPVPPVAPLLASMPSSREYHAPKAWAPLALERGDLQRLRAPVDFAARDQVVAEQMGSDEESADDLDEGEDKVEPKKEVPGAFPGAKDVYPATPSGGGAGSGSAYY